MNYEMVLNGGVSVILWVILILLVAVAFKRVDITIQTRRKEPEVPVPIDNDDDDDDDDEVEYMKAQAAEDAVSNFVTTELDLKPMYRKLCTGCDLRVAKVVRKDITVTLTTLPDWKKQTVKVEKYLRMRYNNHNADVHFDIDNVHYVSMGDIDIEIAHADMFTLVDIPVKMNADLVDGKHAAEYASNGHCITSAGEVTENGTEVDKG